jgi:hypothetical protein
MSNENDINIGELLQIVLSMQAEVGILSDLLLDVLKSGEINKPELIRAFSSLEELSVDALEMLSEEAVDLMNEDSGAQTGNIDNIH